MKRKPQMIRAVATQIQGAGEGCETVFALTLRTGPRVRGTYIVTEEFLWRFLCRFPEAKHSVLAALDRLPSVKASLLRTAVKMNGAHEEQSKIN